MDMAQQGNRGLKTQWELLKILGETGEDYPFLQDLTSEELFIFGGLEKKFPLHLDESGSCTYSDWCEIVYAKDMPAMHSKLNKVIRGELDCYNHEYRLINKQGNCVWIDSRGKCIRDEEGNPLALVGRISDTYLNDKVDWLTGAFNAMMLTKDVGEILKRDIPGYLLVVGVDGLKNINLRRGREHGNQILKKVADMLDELTGEDTRVYRVNSDCFVCNVLTEDPADVEEIFTQLNRKLMGLCTVSAGTVSYHEHANVDAGALHQYAEDALYKAKQNGRACIAFFSQKDYEDHLSGIELQDELKQSIEQGMTGFSVRYQPQIQGGSCELLGAEALMRYHSEEQGDVSPAEFIPVLEQSGLIGEAGMWTLRTALTQCKKWRRVFPDLRISVNMSYVQLDQEGIVDQVLDTLRESGLPGKALCLEITESIQMQDYLRFNKIFYQWKQAGIQISVDDFGTGYSSLGYLKNLDIDEIKIDRCFVRGIQNSAYNYRLLSNIVELARPTQIRVCCEGVETREELAVLKELRVDLLQGFLFDKPLTPGELEDTYIRTGTRENQRYEALKKELGWVQPKGGLVVPEEILPEAEPLDSILDAFDDLIYVSDPISYELYYLNPAARRASGIHDYRGRKCYKVLQGLNEPCPFCTNHLLGDDQFYAWEFYNKNFKRHFICKDKLIFWQGKQARMEIAMDITEKENTSQSVQEKLDFAENVLSGAKALAAEPDMHKATLRMLRSISEFYQADHVSIFEPSFGEELEWINTCLWDRKKGGTTLEQWGGSIPRRWVMLFQADQTLFIENTADLHQEYPSEWEKLSSKKIRRMIVTPIQSEGKLSGFITITNPRHCITDDSMARTLSLFAATRMQCNERYTQTRDLSEIQYGTLLKHVQVSTWTMQLNRVNGKWGMVADTILRNMLGMEEPLPPQECYDYWNSRIREDYRQYMDLGFQTIISTGQMVQMEYIWRHPIRGDMTLRTTGLVVQREGDMIYLEGIFRVLTDLSGSKLIPSTPEGEVFEYDPNRWTLRFQTSRSLLSGTELQENNFPDCWLTGGMVHSHFTQQFVDLLRQARQNGNAQAELMLRGKNGDYEWFSVSAHAMKKPRGSEVVRVVLDPADREKVLQLEIHRMREFYRASLSDSIAYLEMDLENGQLKSAGGLWSGYDKKYDRNMGSLLQFMRQKVENVLRIDESLQPLIEADAWRDVLSKEETIHRFRYQRWMGDEWRWVELRARSFREHHTNSMFALLDMKDVDDQVRREQTQKEAAEHDPLTGVYNRTAFEKRICQYMNDPDGDRCGLLAILDLDNFKEINDTRGHLEGDSALQYFSRLLQKIFRHGDVVGRLGGDEFLVFLQGDVSNNVVNSRMSRLHVELAAYPGYPISCSMGIVRMNGENFSYRDSLHKADMALYDSKKSGKHSHTFAPD